MYWGSRKGWSLVELAIVVVIIGILAALAIPAFAMILKTSRLNTLANDFRIHGDAIETYAVEEGDFPASHSTHGTFIPGLEELLSRKWLEASPVGGEYEWVYTSNADPAAREGYVQLVETASAPFAINLSDVIKLDQDIDDGNLATGYLQVAGARIRYFVKLGG